MIGICREPVVKLTKILEIYYNCWRGGSPRYCRQIPKEELLSWKFLGYATANIYHELTVARKERGRLSQGPKLLRKLRR